MKLNRLINGLGWLRPRALLRWRDPLAALALFVLIASGFALVRASAGEGFAWPESLSRIFGSRSARALGAVTPDPVPVVSNGLVISQVYGGGGNAGAPYNSDFIELYNRGSISVSINGWSVQYAPATSTSWAVTNLPNVSIAPGTYFLIKEGSAGGVGGNLPTPDVTGTTNMSATSGKVALVSSTTALATSGCPFNASVVDFVGYGTDPTCAEGSPTSAPGNAISVIRKNSGEADTDNNLTDFATGAPTPRNSATAANILTAGTYAVGTGGNYVTLTAAIADYNSKALTGPVVFSLTDATYPSETYPITIGTNGGASATNTLTIKPATGGSSTFSANTANPLLILNGAAYATIDGSNTSGGTSKDLTLENTNSSGGVIRFITDANNNTVKNCQVNGLGTASFNRANIYFGPATPTSTISNNTIQNNTIKSTNPANPTYGILLDGSSAATQTGTTITGNTFNQLATAVLVNGQYKATTVSNNEFFDIVASDTNFRWRISVNATNGTTTISGNNVHDLKSTSTGGILWGFTSAPGVGDVVNIHNNFISLDSTNQQNLGIENLPQGGTVNVYHNSVRLSGGTSAYDSFAFAVAGVIGTVTAKDNILVNLRGASGAAKSYGYFVFGPDSLSLLTSNYNDVYVTGTQSVFGYDGTADHANLAAWQSVTGKDANSISADPLFTSITDLHINPLTAGTSPVSNAGTPIAGITTDFDGEARNVSTPDVGADEFSAPSIAVTGGPLTFPDTFSGFVSAEQTYTVSGSSLTGDITVTAPSTDFQVSKTTGTGFGSSVTFTQSAGSVPTSTVYVRFTPQSTGLKSGNITNASTGATTQNIGVSGTGTVADVTLSASGNLAAGTYHDVTINNCGTLVTMTGNVSITGTLTINNCAALETNGFTVSGGGAFTLASGGTLTIHSVNGITSSGATGDVQVTGTRTFSTGANYVYAGNANQAVGNGLPLTVANLKIANTGSVGNNTVTNNANQVVTGTLEVQTGIYSSHSDYVDVLIDVGGTLSLAADITVSGNWTNNGTFNNGGFKVTFDGTSNQTIGGSNLSAFATLAISNTGASGSNTVSLAQSVSDTALNVTSGVFDQGASSNLASGAITISGGATWKDIGTGDITLSGGVANSGAININGGTVVCGETQDVSISSSGASRPWSGFGTFVIKDVHVSNQGGLALIHVENGSDDGGNGVNWIFTPATCTGGTLYTWNPPLPGTDSKYTTQINWTPTRTTPNAADVLVVDGATTPTTGITDIPTETIGRFRFINGTAATLSASAANTLTIAGEGSAVFDFDVAGSSQVKLSGSNTLTVSLATGATGNIDNLLSFEGTGNKLIAADASAITFPSATNCTVIAGYTGNPFGTGSPGNGANGSVIFNTGSVYTHFSGNSPFGDSSHNVVVFNTGSLARFYTATGFEANGRTYANLEIGSPGTPVVVTDSGTGTFRFDNLTLNNTGNDDSSLTFTGSGAGSVLIFGNIRSTGSGIGASATIATVSLTSGSGGIQISNGAGITFDNIGNSRSILFGSDATVASGTNLSLGRIIQNNFLNPNAVLTVNGSITPNVGAPGYIVGNERRNFAGPGPVDFTFDVGGPAGYSPLDAKNTNGAGSLTVQAKEPGLPSISGANKLQRYWTLSGTGITTDLTFHYRGGAPAAGDVNGNEANYVVFKLNGALIQPLNQSVDTVNHTATVTGVNAFSSWTLAEPTAVSPGTLAFAGAPYSTPEGNSGAHDVTITVTRSGGADGAVSVHWATSAGSASAGTDYVEASGDLNWGDGEPGDRTFVISVKEDVVYEADETLNITLSNATGDASIGGPNPTTLTINNDDSCAPFSTVYVDDDWAVKAIGEDPDGVGGPATFFGCDSFATIQEGINGVTAGGTVIVYAGNYKENPTANKAVTLQGPNVGVSGSAVRAAESNVITNGNQNAVFTITSSNVTIDGFVIDGDDTAIAGTPLASGDDTNVAYGVRPTGALNHITVQNNIIKRVAIGFRGDGASQNNLITANWFDSVGYYDFGYAVSLRNNYYADVTNNKMTRAWTGLHTNSFFTAGGPATWSFSGNEVHSYAAGLAYWLQFQNATGLTINNNQFSAEASALANNFGVLMVSIQDTVSPTFTNNTITGTDYGVGLTNTSTSNVITIGPTNSITGTKLAGVYLTDNLTFDPVGTPDLTSNVYTGAANNIAVNLTGLPVSIASGSAIKVQNSRSSAADVTSTATISGSTIGGAGSKGLEVIGPLATVSMTASTITGLGTGIALQNSSATPLTIVAHFNRIIAAAAIDNPNNQVVDLENNWWGCNAGPGNTGCGTVTGTGADFDPRIVLGVTASPNPTTVGGDSTITADMTKNSDGNSPAGVTALPLPNALFTPTNGTIDPASNSFTAGQSQATFTLTAPGNGQVCTTVDNQQACTTAIEAKTTDVSLSSGNLVIGDVNGDNTDDALTISLNGSNVRITDPNHPLNCGEGATTINANTCEVPFASITGNIQVNTLGGNDSLTVDLSSGDCIPNGGLSYDGGAQTTGDKLSITGGSQGTVTYNYANANDGSIVMSNFGTVTYTGLEPITNSGTATDVIFNLPAAGNVATLSGLGGGNSRLASTGTFEVTDFANPSGSVTINGGALNDSISVGALDANYPSLTINGNEGSDTVGFTGNTTFAAGASLDVNLQNDDPTPGIDNVFVNGQLIVSGAGKIDIRASEDVTVNSGGKLQVENGELTIEANQQDPSTATDHNGVDVNGGTIQSIGTGNISITGTGGEGSFDTMYGVIVWNGGKILSTGTGTITVKGAGGARTGGAPASPPSELYGVYVYLSGSEISSVSGAIEITGQGGATNDTGSYGVMVEGGKIQQSGAGALTIDGTGGTCTGGNASFANSIGVTVVPDKATPTPAGGLITSTGTGLNAGNISITGIAGDGGNGGSQGVRVDGPGKVTTVDGSLTFDGTGATGAISSLGISIRGAVTASGTGAISMTGAGANAAGGSPTHGVNVRSGGAVTAKDGDITITGTGGNGADNAGFDLAPIGTPGTGSLRTTGTGNIIINADRIHIRNTNSARINAGANSVSIRPRTPATFIDLGSTTDTTPDLELSDAELDQITCGTLNIGDNNSESITVTADITRSVSTNMALTAGCDIVISGGQVNTGGGTLLLDSGPSPDAVRPTKSGTDVTVSTLSFGSDLSIVINGLNVDTDYTQLNVSGDVNLTGVDLVLSGLHTPAVGETFTIVNNGGGNLITGTFNGLAEGATIPDFLIPGATATISYVGGTGNDVVLTVQTVPTSADLTVTKSAPASVPEGSDFTYTITVSNSASATATATGVTVSDTLPAGVTFVSVSPTPACSESAGTVTCTGLPDIPAGDSDTVEIVVTAGSAPATVQNTASASATNDPNSPHTSNTTSTAIITCPTEFVVNSTGDGSDANPGDSICETASGNAVCTLRAAIEEANAFNDICGYLTVKFNIPDNDAGHVYYKDDGIPNQVTNDLAHIGATTFPVANDSSLGDIDPDYPHSWWRIQPLAGLPSINVALDIDGYTQSGSSTNTKHLNEGDDAILRIEIDGSQTAFTHGLSFTEASGDYSVITGLVINHFNHAHDLFVDDEGGHIFSGNFLGVDVSGTLGDGTIGTGIFLNSGEDTLIGGDCKEDRNVISGHGGEGGAGIWINTDLTTVEGNYIGTDRNGAVAIPNTSGVIITSGDGNVIGCEVLDGDNVISGNTNIGVSIGDGFGNLVEGNFIGTDKTGQLAIPNKTGISLFNSFFNAIGFGFGNVISGNTEDGVVLKDASSANVVQTNLIGVAFDGTTPLGNGGNGVEVYTGSTDNIIGEFFDSGPSPGARFEARAQSLGKGAGRTFKESASQPAAKAQAGKVQVRKAPAGKARVGARKHSRRDRGARPSFREFFDQRLAKVRLGAAKKQAFVNKRSSAGKGASAANITPETCGCPSGANVIANNTGDGVKVSSDGDLYNRISQNSIYSNGGLGINLVKNDPSTEPPSTVTANDPGDGDLGPNELQNFPVIVSASAITGIVHFSFDTCDEGPYVIEFFANAAGCDPSGNGEGQTYLGFIEVSGSGTYDSDPLSLSPGDVITATATDVNGNTSEFSACFALAPAVVANVSVALNGPTSVAENGATNLVYRFTRDDTSAPLTVNFSAAGTADSSNDYVILTGPNVSFNGSTGTVNFGAGVDHVDVTVDPTADGDFESSETVIITVTSASGYNAVNPSSATGTITDDDCPTIFTVTHAIDTHDAVPGDGNCGDSLQRCTLRAAIEEANALANCGTIDINFAFSVETIIVLPLGELLVQHNVNIIGPTTYPLSIDGNGQYRAFHIDSGKIVTISDLTITDCVTSGDGGGILNNGTLALKGVTVEGNSAVNGGGIASVTNNLLTLINTTISGNTSTGNGGGLYNDTGIAKLTNVTIAYNTANGDGAGSESGGGIFVASGDVTLHNTIAADNLKGLSPATTADDIQGLNVNAASSYNLIGTGSGGLINGGNNNQVGVATALLKPLQENGGSTRTHALVYNSPAVDSGDDCVVTGCSGNSPVVNTDQRGKSRPSDGDNNGSSIVDIGAYERQVTEVRDVLQGFDSNVDVVDAIITFPCAEPPCIGSRVNPGSAKRAEGDSAKRASGVAPSVASPTASLTLIDAAPLNSLTRPPNTAIGNSFNPPLPAFEVTTTANYTPPATVCFYLPSITNPTFFAGLKVLHREAGPNTIYGDSDDVMVDRTRTTNPTDFANKLVCSDVNSFSAFAIAQTVSVTPTAEHATVSGQILDNQGNPVEGAAVRMSGTQDRLTITDAEGKYHFEDVETNGFYVITPSRANFTFSPAQTSFSQLGANTEATFTGAASGGGLNPLDVTEYFVRQQYLDFLGREPDNSGFNFWVNNIESCGNDIGCREAKRIDTSAAFFLSIESQQTGYLIYRFYQAAYGEIPNTPVPLRLSEYTTDAARISKGVVVLQNGWQRTLENNTRAFAEDFVKRERFVAAYPLTMTPVEFVDKLFANGHIPVIDSDHAAAIAEFDGAPDTSDASARARALRRIAENSVLARRHFNRAFVLIEYFGYLRRDPNSGPDRDFSGFNFWLDKLDRFDGNFRDAEMVKAFLTSIEYRARILR